MFMSNRKFEAIVRPGSEAVEAYRALLFNLQWINQGSRPKTIMITSALPNEGKTTTLANLAVTCARSGIKTVAVDFNLRNPRLHQVFGTDHADGVRICLHAPENWENAVRPTRYSDLSVITAGRATNRAAEELALAQVDKLLSMLKSAYDAVLVDTPAATSVDPLYLAPYCDVSLLVIQAGKTKRSAVQKTHDRLKLAGAHRIGAVLNRIPGRKEVMVGGTG